MFKKKECIAMLLAGGQGSRLYALTENVAKPAVPFGGKYRIIDFTLTNCINSGIDTVGVLTQYQPLLLNEYIGNGQPWDLDRTYGGVTILPPYQGKKKSDWYKGTANAIYQNLNFIQRYDPEYVLILSGDHIYKMDYSKMLNYHKQKKADITIAVIDVPLSEASRFGIMSVSDKGKIFKFEEKPKNPDSTMASMGIYIFSTKKLVEYLTADENTEGSSNDFGKNVIPSMLNAKEKMFAYHFDGYWKDVGTLNSLWEANMDLLGENPSLSLNDANRKIFSRTSAEPPQYVGKEACIKNSLITSGCEVYGTVENSVLFAGVTVEKGAYIKNSVVMNNCIVKQNSKVIYSIIDENSVIGQNAVIGRDKTDSAKLTVLGGGVEIADSSSVKDGEMITKSLKNF